MISDVEFIDSVESVIGDFYCIAKMVGEIRRHIPSIDPMDKSHDKEIKRILNRFVISSKSLGNDSSTSIPEFVHKPSVDHFNKELQERFPDIELESMHEALAQIRDNHFTKHPQNNGKLNHPKEVDDDLQGVPDSWEDQKSFMVIEYVFSGGVAGRGRGRCR